MRLPCQIVTKLSRKTLYSHHNIAQHVDRWREARPTCSFRNSSPHVFRCRCAPGEIVRYHRTFEAHGQKRPPAHRFIQATWFQGNGNSKIADITRKRANAPAQPPLTALTLASNSTKARNVILPRNPKTPRGQWSVAADC